jgi:phage replication O-like protein O
MANPQAENGHVDLANEIIENFYRLQLSGNQWRVLWVIVRQTYGWKKKSDRISISFFEKRTGLKRRHIVRALKDMVERKIITKNDTTFISTYGFQKDYSKWKLLPKKTLSAKNDTKTVTNFGTHKRNSKETILRDSKKPNPAIKEFFAYWDKAFREKTGKDYFFNRGKEGSLTKKMLNSYSIERLKELVGIFFKSQDHFFLNSGYTIGFFYSQINKVVIEAEKAKSKW